MTMAFVWQETVAYVGVAWAVAAVLIAALVCGWKPWK